MSKFQRLSTVQAPTQPDEMHRFGDMHSRAGVCSICNARVPHTTTMSGLPCRCSALLTDAHARARAQEKPHFWKRKPSIVKVHMLLLAHLARAEVPRSLQADARFLLAKAPLLLEEMVKIANLPRPPAGYGWLSPTVGALEMMQCLTRAQPLHVRKTAPGGKARPSARAVLRMLLVNQFR